MGKWNVDVAAAEQDLNSRHAEQTADAAALEGFKPRIVGSRGRGAAYIGFASSDGQYREVPVDGCRMEPQGRKQLTSPARAPQTKECV